MAIPPVGRRLPHGLLCLAAVLVCLCSAGPAAEQQAATFRFSPPDGNTCIQTIDTTQVLDLGGGRTTTRQTQLTTRLTMRRKNEHHLLTSTVLDATTQSDLKASVDDLARQTLKGAAITYDIDANNRLVGMSGIEEVLRRMTTMLSPQALAVVSKALTKQVMLASAQADWNHSVGNLVGRPARRGEAWLATEQYPTLEGKMTDAYVALKVTGRTTMAGRECLVVRYEFNPDPQKLLTFLGASGAAAIAGKSRFRSTSTLTGSGQMIVDPETLLCYGETLRRTLQTTVEVPGQGAVPVTIRQTKKYEYDYNGTR